MGLPLYQPPVESDLPSKTPLDRTARLRSSIRRALDRNEDRIRERRRRVLAAAITYPTYDPERRAALSGRDRDLPHIRAAMVPTGILGARSGSEHDRRPLREPSRRTGLLDDRLVTIFGERWAHLHAESNPSPLRTELDAPHSLPMAVESAFLPRPRPLRPEPTYALSSIRSTQSGDHVVSMPPFTDLTDRAGLTQEQANGTSRPASTIWSRMRRQRTARRGESRQSPDETSDGPRAAALGSSSSRSPWAAESPEINGLGDRNRSLSPEGDNVWDTLLSTLTPDPQPPSVGSSFASTSASAVASQSTATASSRTSFTAPERLDDDSAEPPCESGCDNSDTEGDDDDDDGDMMQLPLIPGLGGPSRRSRAGRPSTDDPLEYLGGIGGMQRIVRNLARREDIPDEWWADAGLSRTLPREAPGN